MQKELDKREEVVAETTQAHDIDWSDPDVLRYHAQQNRFFSKAKQSAEEEKLKKNDDSSKPSGRSRKKTLSRKRASEKQIPREEFAMDVESLSTKYPIVDWKTHILTENFMYYQIIRADGSFKNYKIFSEMIDDFDRQDVMDLHRLVKERYVTTSPEGYDLMLWGDLKTLFEPNEEDEV
ncbi:hypothetical protein Tco_0710315 [Tanacetum coccineum]